MKTGQCLCGAVRITAEVPDHFMACHCTQCQRWTGGGPLYSIDVRNVTVEGEDSVATYRHSAHGERCFCKKCGTTLWWKMQDHGISSVTPALFDDQTGLRLTEEIFVDYRAPWMAAEPGATQSTEAEEMAKLDAYLKEKGQ